MPLRCPRARAFSTSREKSACCRMERCPRRSRHRPSLADTGMGVEGLVKITTYLVRSGDVVAAGAARTKHFGDARPGSATIIVKALVSPAFLIEIEAVAAAAAHPR